jgi:hypothetical protein
MTTTTIFNNHHHNIISIIIIIILTDVKPIFEQARTTPPVRSSVDATAFSGVSAVLIKSDPAVYSSGNTAVSA